MQFYTLVFRWNFSGVGKLLKYPKSFKEEIAVGRGIFLWMLGVPIPIIILLALFFHH